MCEHIKFADGSVAIICGVRRGTPAKCQFCRRRPHTKLCDFDIGNGKTCDARMCDSCTTNVGPNRDYCPAHREVNVKLPATKDEIVAGGWTLVHSRRCKLCNALLDFYRTLNGALMPCEPAVVDGVKKYVSHFATCPHADKFRRHKEPKPAAPKTGELFT